MRAAKTDPLLSSSMQLALLKSFETRLESRQIQLAIKLFQGTFSEKSLHLQEAQK